jgi:hypothetical protein
MKVISQEEYKKRYGEDDFNRFAGTPTSSENKGTSSLLSPAKESLSSLKTLYGGGEQGIAMKLKNNVQEGAADIQKGFQSGDASQAITGLVKGTTKSALRMGGDVLGTIFAPVGAALEATGINKAFDAVGNAVVDSSLGQKLTDNPTVQKFAMEHPNAGEDFSRALNIALAGLETGKVKPSTIAERTKAQFTPKPKAPAVPEAPAKTIEQMRAEKIKQGFEEQNTRLKSADKSFSKNTKVYTNPDGTKTTVTPVDTFAKYNITPTVEKGGIDMGDYQMGTGALGKIKENVLSIDEAIDTSLKNTGRGVPLDDFKTRAIEAIKRDETLKESGKVGSTVKKLEGVFDDFKESYGETVQEIDVNNIRKTMNRDFNLDTVDVSRVIGDVAREIVYNSTPEQTVKTLLRQQGELLSAKKYAETVNGTKVTGGRLGNMAMRTAGAVAGSTLHNMPVIGPLLGMVGGEYLARAMQQTQFKSPIVEAKAFFQRSNSNTPTTNANTIPSKASIPENTTPSQKPVNMQGGYIKNPLKSATPVEVSKSVDSYDLVNIRDYLKTGNIRSFQRLTPLFEATGIDNMTFTDLNIFLKKVLELNTQKLPVTSSKK